MIKKQFSLVVTCRNEMKSISRWKSDILSQTRFPDEIVIVDSESNDGTIEFLNNWQKETSCLKLIVQNCKPAKGHNIGNAAAVNDIILSTDMGVSLSANWCEELIKPFEIDSTIEIVAGNTCIDQETIISKVAHAEYYIENGGASKLGPGFIPGNRSTAYTKKIWSQLNGLSEDLTFYADDSVFGRQMVQSEFKFAYAPKAMTYWARPSKLKHFYREHFVYGKGDGEAFIKTPRAFKYYLENKLPGLLLIFSHVIVQFFKLSMYQAMNRALKKRDLSAFCIIPIMIAGRSFNYIKGYKAGYKNGEINCLQCRQRLKRDPKGYSII